MDTTSTRDPRTCAVIGPGRLGRALVAALRRGPTAPPGAPAVPAGVSTAPSRWTVAGPFGRDDAHRAAAADVVLLCVPDAAIAGAAAALPPAPAALVGHCSGATGLDVLLPHEGFSLHPLMTVTRRGADLRGAGAAVDGPRRARWRPPARWPPRSGCAPSASPPRTAPPTTRRPRWPRTCS